MAALLQPGIPVVDVSDEPTSTPVLRTMRLIRQHGPVFVQRQHGQDALLVSSLELVTELSDEQRFGKAVGPALENVREFAHDGLFTAYDDEPNWAKAHDILMPAFALGSMRAYHPVMLRVARRLIEAWDRRCAAGSPVDVADDMTRMTLDTIGLAGFGFDFGSFERDEPHPFVDALVRCLHWAMTRLSRDPDADHSRTDEAFRTDAAFLASVVDEVIAARTAPGAPSPDDEDLLGLMLSATHPSDGTTLDLANIRDQVITFLIAGHETTSGTLSFALHNLVKHPTALRMVQREVDELWGDQPDPEPTFEDIGRLHFTRQVLNETLRMFPPAPGFSRQARHDTALGGIPMRAGQWASVVTPMLHRDPVWGDNPELFDPARFTPEAEAARSPHAFKPFGTGERACIGRQFALHEATMLLAMLVHRYRLLDHADYQLRIKQTLTIKPDGLTLALARRTSADRVAAPARTTEAPVADNGLPTRVRPGTGVLLLHGSNYGTCRDFSAQLADATAEIGCDTATAALDDHTGALPTDRPVVITAASYNGQPTDDAAEFIRWLDNAEPGAADGVTYAVLGVGDRNWSATYQRIPTYLDARLADLGGTRLLERAEADAAGDLTGAVKAFTAALRNAVLQEHGDPASVGADQPASPAHIVTELTGGPLDALAARHGMTPMTVTETASLTSPGYSRTKRFVRLELPEGETYRTADHLTVLPANDPALVERAARILRVDLDTVLSIAPRRDGIAVDRPVTVRELLTRHVELQDRPTSAQLSVLAELDPCPPEQQALRALAEDPDHRTLLDVVEDNPALIEQLTWPVLLELLPPIRPRHYSISSSPVGDPHHVDLMVSLLEAPARSGRGTFRGTGSGFLDRVRAGDTVLARVQPCRAAFRVDHEVPVIMVSAGTGLAPFRGAIADRLARAANGERLAPALCYFGCDAPDADYLHSAELRAAELAGAVEMRPAFSAEPVDGQAFVQHRIAAEADELWRLLGDGAKIYVCGDGTRMAPGVREAFRAIHAERAGGDGTAWLDSLVADGRYVEDVHTAR
ncbi:cytochrome P450 / NADPH-cytochrome P450 reductase [Saccharopolyspora kobensis]|uniref:Bifunctional cytochrome P450/NADPH--P450 reductase n=1 Tax=Saccharopolyspora kobensis TaxID=146035 RepID=A0A1H6ASU0_9PSEU|nr:cytochrome P450 [Saccharopolyspora kobensis]SEG51135.1 cytochrome P450 / NADPH-cytochrome P450 reductase [Saccharopolyspora kobensis]SFE77121.1 cytochrome P450 / NADPH-cytochrome P450 reductase [Saccharopolyspora kobensis]